LVIDEFASSRWGTSAGNKIIGCASAALVAAIAETISSAFLFLKVSHVHRRIRNVSVINYT